MNQRGLIIPPLLTKPITLIKTCPKQFLSMESKGLVLDRLSNLPDEILLEILCRTKSYKTCVASSSLSKRWKDLYLHIPDICFEDLMEPQFAKDTRTLKDRIETFNDIIRTAVSRHRTEIRTLSLHELPESVTRDCLRFASSITTIKNLVIDHYLFSHNGCYYPLVRSPYTRPNFFSSDDDTPLASFFNNYSNLVTLELSRCTINRATQGLSETFLGFPCLESCIFKDVDFDGVQWMRKIFVLSPMLRTIKLVRCRFSKLELKISCPTVKTMVIDGYLFWMCKHLVLQCPNLADLTVDFKFLESLHVSSSLDMLTITSIPKPSASLWNVLTNTIQSKHLSFNFGDIFPTQVSSVARNKIPVREVLAESVALCFRKFGEEESQFASHVLGKCPNLSVLFIRVNSSLSYATYEKLISDFLSVYKASSSVKIKFGSKDLLNETIEI